MKYLLIIAGMLVVFSCKQKFDSKTYEDNKVSLAQRESEHPERFIHLSAGNKKNLFGITVVKGTIVNTASVAAYKNTRIKMLCYNNGIRVEEHEDVVPDIIKPGAVKNFKVKYHLPKGTDSLALSIMSADTLEEAVAVSKE